MKPARAALLLLLSISGCSRGFFTARGVLTSDGGTFGHWSSKPQGCSRDPIDSRPSATSASIASFFWEDPAAHHITLRDQNAPHAPDVPLRLDLLREDGTITARFQTVKTPGTRLDATVCTTLAIQTTESPATYTNGRPTLSGTVQLDCRLKGSHLTGNFHFQNCEF
jgi:hypothetical protein